jgi:hypothetical protein
LPGFPYRKREWGIGMCTEYARQIDALIKSFCPLFCVGSPNGKLMKETCCDLGARNSLEVIGYNISQGV